MKKRATVENTYVWSNYESLEKTQKWSRKCVIKINIPWLKFTNLRFTAAPKEVKQSANLSQFPLNINFPTKRAFYSFKSINIITSSSRVNKLNDVINRSTVNLTLRKKSAQNVRQRKHSNTKRNPNWIESPNRSILATPSKIVIIISLIFSDLSTMGHYVRCRVQINITRGFKHHQSHAMAG